MSEVLAQLEKKGGGGSAELAKIGSRTDGNGTKIFSLADYVDQDRIVVNVINYYGMADVTVTDATTLDKVRYAYNNVATTTLLLTDITSNSSLTSNSGSGLVWSVYGLV